MKKNNVLLGAIIAVFFISSCGNSTDSTSENQEGQNADTLESSLVETPSATKVNDDALDAVYQEYQNLNQALVNSSYEEAKISASALSVAAKEFSNEGEIAKKAAEIAEAGTLKEQREAFFDLSNELIEKIKNTGMAAGEIYVDYCPMAFNNTGGYWLSSEKGIKNPYFGDQMMTCGETTETIK